jgi:D-threo-aldose 1-dehydrogenase
MSARIFGHERLQLGGSGTRVPPIIFGTAALGNVPRIIPEQRKLAICGEWFKHVEPPVWVDVAYHGGDGVALETLSRVLRRIDIPGDEVVVHLTLDSNQLPDDWQKSCQWLGDEYRPKLLSVCQPGDEVCRVAGELKAAGMVSGVGIATKDVTALQSVAFSFDWLVLANGFSLLRHPPELREHMGELSERQIPVIISRVFAGGFLVGGNRLDGRILNGDDPADRSILAWRKSFVALCEGHGITPAHACIQFALSAPAVVAMLIETSYPDRVVENIRSVSQKVPDNFWAAMREEGLLSDDS